MAHLQTVGIAIDLDEQHLARLRAAFPELTFRVESDPAALPHAFADIDLYVGSSKAVERLLEVPSLRWIQTTNAGANAAPLDVILQRGILYTNASGTQAPALAEHIIGLMFAFARGLPTMIRRQQQHSWSKDGKRFEVAGQTLCVVGLGDIGLQLASRASALGMCVTGVRRRQLPALGCVSRVVLFDEMDDLLPLADHVAICLPLTPNTQHMFDAPRLARMKSGAYIYNVGRGEIIDQDALVDALRSGHLAGAGLDVVTPEPLPSDSPLWDMQNVIITSHTGGSPARRDRLVDLLIDNISRYRNDEPLRNVVDLREGY
jgi:D-2-hydroxyacid dehydrogenase (NADP+)